MTVSGVCSSRWHVPGQVRKAAFGLALPEFSGNLAGFQLVENI